MVRLSQVVAPSNEKTDPANVADQPYIGLEHIEAHTTRLLGHGLGRDVRSTKAVYRKGDLLYGKLRPYLGKICIAPFGGVASTDILVFPQTPLLDSQYLLRFLSQPRVAEFASHHSSGTQLPRISFSALGDLPFPLPPVPEQRRISERLEQLVAKLDSCRDRLDRIPEILSRFRKAVLAAACSGRLTEEWRDQHRIEAPRLESINVQDVPPFDLPGTWRWIPFSVLLIELRNGISTKPQEEPPGRAILRISAVRPLRVNSHDVRYLRSEETDLHVYGLRARDLLFTRYNGNQGLVGACGMVRELGDRHLTYPDKLIRARVNDAHLLPEYAELYFSAPDTRARVLGSSKSSAGQWGISGADLKAQPVAVPPIPEQAEIVRCAGALLSLCAGVCSRAEKACATTMRLHEAVLARAFRGELVPTEAELAAQEGRGFEPAEELLARIRSSGHGIPPSEAPGSKPATRPLEGRRVR